MAADRLSNAEWGALLAASAQLEVDWKEDGDLADRRQYAALERAIDKVSRTMRAPRKADHS